MTRDMMLLTLENSIARARREGFFATADALSDILEELKNPTLRALNSEDQIPNGVRQI